MASGVEPHALVLAARRSLAGLVDGKLAPQAAACVQLELIADLSVFSKHIQDSRILCASRDAVVIGRAVLYYVTNATILSGIMRHSQG